MNQSADYTFRFRPLASNVPAACRARKLLKTALRSYGMRCVDYAIPGRPMPRIHASVRLTAADYGVEPANNNRRADR